MPRVEDMTLLDIAEQKAIDRLVEQQKPLRRSTIALATLRLLTEEVFASPAYDRLLAELEAD